MANTARISLNTGLNRTSFSNKCKSCGKATKPEILKVRKCVDLPVWKCQSCGYYTLSDSASFVNNGIIITKELYEQQIKIWLEEDKDAQKVDKNSN